MDNKTLSILIVVLAISILLNIERIFELYKYIKKDNKSSSVSAPGFINEDGLMLLSLFMIAIKVERYSNNSMDEWNNNFKAFKLYFNDKDPLNIVYLKDIGVNIYDAKTDEVKHSIFIEECDTYSIKKVMNMISRAHYFYEEGKDENVWN